MHIEGWVKVILDSLYDGILIVDENAIVQYVNDSYTRITNTPFNKIVGKPLRMIRPGARLPEVLETGETLLRIPRKEEKSEYIVNMSPIKTGNKIFGAISVVTEITDAFKLAEELDRSHDVLKKLQNHVVNIHKAKYSFDDIICDDPNSKKAVSLAKKFAGTNSTVLIYGESGTGKELFANAIHNFSQRRNNPFIAVNCATLSSQLLESELFGYEEGAFTGAKKGGKIGLFEVANKGTIFLDEITEMDYSLQAKLLRTLQENTIRRVGGFTEIPIDVRVIAATNKEIESLIAENKFREDLYYRIKVLPLSIPPLRERKGDIKHLIMYFLKKIQLECKRSVFISDEAINYLCNYSWPGNVRELKNVLEFAVNMSEDYIIETGNLPISLTSQQKKPAGIKPLKESLKEKERLELQKALMLFGDTLEGKKKAAEALGISLASLYNKLN